MDRAEIENFVSDSVRSAVSERQNELLDSVNSLLNNRFDSFEKNFSEKQSAISENQMSRLRSSALGQYQFKRKSCEEQFNFNASLESKFSDIDSNLSNLSAESVVKAKDSASEGKTLIQQRQKLLKLADSSELGWKVVSEYQSNPLASDSEDEKKIYKAELRAERKVRKDQMKRNKGRKSPFSRLRYTSSTSTMPQAQVQVQTARPTMTAATNPTTTTTKPGLCWYCGGVGHWRFECEALKKAQANNKISIFDFSTSQLNSNVVINFGAIESYTHECATGMVNSSTTSEVIIQDVVSAEIASETQNADQGEISPVGRLRSRYSQWEKVTNNSFILGVIKEGYKIPFKELPDPVELRNNKSARDNAQFVSKEIKKLLVKGCVTEVKEKPTVINPLTVATNKSGKQRLVLDCRHLNKCLAKFKFKYEDVSIARQMFEKGTYLFCFDLRGAYHHIDITLSHRTFLGFQWKEGETTRYYTFSSLPFGLATAGYIFTKVLRVLVQYWRSVAHQIVMFLDDGIGGHKDRYKAVQSSDYIKRSLDQFGFLIAQDKCKWEPSLEAVWLGYYWNMAEGKLYVTLDRIKRLELSVESMLYSLSRCEVPLVKVRFLACIVGQIISMQTVLGKKVQLKTRELYRCIMSRASWNAPVRLTEVAIAELDFWKNNVRSMNSKGQYIAPNVCTEISLYSDSSSEGYGGYVYKQESLRCDGIFVADKSVLESVLSLKSEESEEVGRITESDIALETGNTPERDIVLESDISVLESNTMCDHVWSGQKSRPFSIYLSKMFKTHENLDPSKLIKSSVVTGSWSKTEQLQSSTWREVEAVRRVMFHNADLIKGKKVKIYSDNKNVKSVLTKGSNKSDLQILALKVSNFCDTREITLLPEWLPRDANTTADFLSKVSPADDWGISNWVFQFLDKAWGPHDVDRFSSNLNNKCERFNSKYWVPGTEAVDAFDQSWYGCRNWMVPPPSLGSKVLKKILKEKAEGTLVLPQWRAAPFWPLLLSQHGSFSHVIKAYEILPRSNIITPGRCKKGIFTSNPLTFNMIAFKIRFII